jgi:hypothetical protein
VANRAIELQQSGAVHLMQRKTLKEVSDRDGMLKFEYELPRSSGFCIRDAARRTIEPLHLTQLRFASLRSVRGSSFRGRSNHSAVEGCGVCCTAKIAEGARLPKPPRGSC